MYKLKLNELGPIVYMKLSNAQNSCELTEVSVLSLVRSYRGSTCS